MAKLRDLPEWTSAAVDGDYATGPGYPTAPELAKRVGVPEGKVIEFVMNSAGDPKMNPCAFRRAIALSDLNRAPVRSFHKFMINCLATNGSSPYASLASTQAPVPNACRDLTFDKVPQDAY